LRTAKTVKRLHRELQEETKKKIEAFGKEPEIYMLKSAQGMSSGLMPEAGKEKTMTERREENRVSRGEKGGAKGQVRVKEN